MGDTKAIQFRAPIFIPERSLVPIRCKEDARRLTNKYGSQIELPGNPPKEMTIIDWNRLHEDHPNKKGVVLLIAPHKNDIKMGDAISWVQLWDVRSGALWDVKGISNGDPVRNTTTTLRHKKIKK